jgi:lipoic acid synthetase
MSTLHVRHLGRVHYHEADTFARALQQSNDDYLLLLEHFDVYTCGSGTKPEHLKNLADSEAHIVEADRGGSITFHGPGQLVGYPIVSIETTASDLRASLRYIRDLEDVLINALDIVGVAAQRLDGYTGVWVVDESASNDLEKYKKIAAIGVKVAHGRTRHGFALNISPRLDAFHEIIPCGINEYSVTSLHELGFDHISQDEMSETLTKCFLDKFHYDAVSHAGVTTPSHVQVSAFTRDAGKEVSDGVVAPSVSQFTSAVSAAQPQLRLLGRLAQAGVAVDETKDRRARPEWMKNSYRASEGYQELKELSRDLSLHTVCEEAGCPNIYECWESKTATFMILGERCTRACGFCLVDTRKPQSPDPNEPHNVAIAVQQLGLEFAVLTCVARDDLDDDGSDQFVQTMREIRKLSPQTQIELLISDCRGHEDSLDAIFSERPDVLNHNIETPARLQRAVRPSASYVRSLAVLARAKSQGLTTKSGIIVGMARPKKKCFRHCVI